MLSIYYVCITLKLRFINYIFVRFEKIVWMIVEWAVSNVSNGKA